MGAAYMCDQCGFTGAREYRGWVAVERPSDTITHFGDALSHTRIFCGLGHAVEWLSDLAASRDGRGRYTDVHASNEGAGRKDV